MATIAEFASGSRDLDSDSLRERFISECWPSAVQHYCVGKCTSPRRGVQSGRLQGPMAAGPGVRALLRLARRRDQLLLSGLVHDNHPVEPPASETATTWPTTCDKAVEFIRDAKVIDPDKPFFMYLAPRRDTPSPGPAGMGGPVQGVFDEGYEVIRAGILQRQIDLGLLPEAPSCPSSTTREPERTGPTARPGRCSIPCDPGHTES